MYVNKTTDRRSVSGGAMLCAGACVLRTHKCAPLSTTEAEYAELTDTIKEAMYMRYAWSFVFLGFGETCITVFKDNEGARHIAQTPVCT